MQKYSEYFGEREKLQETDVPRVQCQIEFDEDAVDRITKKVYHGIDVNKKGYISQEDMRAWTKAILTKKFPNMPFSEEAFQKGFGELDTTKDGQVNIDDIRMITMKKINQQNLYSGE